MTAAPQRTGNKMTAARKPTRTQANRGPVKAVAGVVSLNAYDVTLNRAVSEAVTVLQWARRNGRHVSVDFIAAGLALATDEAAALMPVEPMHSGMSWTSRWVT